MSPLHSFPPSIQLCGTMFAIGAIPANLLWFRMAHLVRAKGLEFPICNFGVFTGLGNFRRVLRAESDPERKVSYRLLLGGFFFSFAWCLFWFVGFVMAGR